MATSEQPSGWGGHDRVLKVCVNTNTKNLHIDLFSVTKKLISVHTDNKRIKFEAGKIYEVEIHWIKKVLKIIVNDNEEASKSFTSLSDRDA